MDSTEAQTVAKNIWELERLISGGKANNRARQALLRAYSQQVDFMEEERGIAEEDRSRLRVVEGSRDGVLLVHGSTGTPADLNDLARAIYDSGFTIYNVRLPGHGVPGGPTAMTPWNACLTDVENRYRMLSNGCAHVYVVGFSFGATLALHLRQKPRPRALIMLAPALYPRLGPFQQILAWFGLDRTEWMRRRLGWNGEVLAAMDSARRQDWWHETPMFLAMASDDQRVNPRGMSFLKSRSSHQRTSIRAFPTGGHMFLRGDAKAELHAAVIDFLRQN